MEGFIIKRVWLDQDTQARQEWEQLIKAAHLFTGECVDYTVAIYNEDSRMIATGSSDRNILKCLAVHEEYKAENLLTRIVMALLSRLSEMGWTNSFIYTKPDNQAIFKSLGYQPIVVTKNLAFMQQGYPTFNAYLNFLTTHGMEDKQTIGAIVMNANPFTLGHLFLIEQALRQVEHVYVFVVSENRSIFSADDRLKMVRQGTAHLPNVTVLPTSDYMVSSATFPTYFLKDRADLAIANTQAELDAILFKQYIVPVLSIQKRFVGEESNSKVTALYNQVLMDTFQHAPELVVIPRKKNEDQVISATQVRQMIENKDYASLKLFVPETTFNYLVDIKVIDLA